MSTVFTQAIRVFEDRGWYRGGDTPDSVKESPMTCLHNAVQLVISNGVVASAVWETHRPQVAEMLRDAIGPELLGLPEESSVDDICHAIFDWNDEICPNKETASAVLSRAAEAEKDRPFPELS
jgi:hypothetical protein